MSPQGLKCVRENSSFAPPGLVYFPLGPTACAVGFTLTPLRGWKTNGLLHRGVEFRVLTHTLKPGPFKAEPGSTGEDARAYIDGLEPAIVVSGLFAA